MIKLDKSELKKLNFIKKKVLSLSKKIISKNDITKLENIHKTVTSEKLNNFRVKLFHKINEGQFYKDYYNISKKYLDIIVGNEVVSQKKVNLSIQLPGDENSLLPVHSDTWAGDSPFEVVAWVPLVNVFSTNAMFILPKKKYKKISFNKIPFKTNDDLYKKISKHLKFIKIQYGEILIFNQNLPHGNIVNKTNITRWSFNCRFKSLFSPYNQKKFLEFFVPLNIKPATLDGIDYEEPNFK